MSRTNSAIHDFGPDILTEGRSRTHIGVTAPTNINFPYSWRSDATSLYDDTTFGGTSGATPVVTGAAALFRNWYGTEVSSLIDDPAILYVNLLLMGDLWTSNGSLSAPFDNLTGAGRLRLRTFDPEGLDAPAAWETGSVCVDQAEDVTLDIGSGGTIASGAEVLRVVTWWYDSRYDNSSSYHDHDNVDLRVHVGLSVHNSTSNDNRQRVQFTSGVGGAAAYMTLHGRSVTADDEGCGTDSMRVYYAWFYEDDTRDDTDVDLDGATIMNYLRPE